MQKFLTYLLVLSLGSALVAKDIDLEKSKGIDQNVIVTLTPSPAQIDVDQDAVIKAVFNVALDATHVKKNDVKLEKISKKKKKVKGDVTYNENENAVLFTPKESLEVGYYEIEIKSLKPVKEEKDNKIKEIKYRFYVPEVVNGYKLPMEPDESVNNATLLGIDSNNNGVRDDVERYVIQHYANEEYPKTKTAIALQYAWADQKIIENPTKESIQYENDAIDCQWYWFEQKTKGLTAHKTILFSINHEVYDDLLKETIFNTKERLKQYFNYNAALSGSMYPGRVRSLQNCQTDINVIGE